jgi:hypothetical protein
LANLICLCAFSIGGALKIKRMWETFPNYTAFEMPENSVAPATTYFFKSSCEAKARASSKERLCGERYAFASSGALIAMRVHRRFAYLLPADARYIPMAALLAAYGHRRGVPLARKFAIATIAGLGCLIHWFS